MHNLGIQTLGLHIILLQINKTSLKVFPTMAPIKVLMGNGQGLHIKSIGSFILYSNCLRHTKFTLTNLLHYPHINKNIVSTSKFAKDNKVCFEFLLPICLVKLQESDQVLLKGSIGDDGHYSFKNLQIHNIFESFKPVFHFASSCNIVSNKPCTYFTFVGQFSLWHNRLGHSHLNGCKICPTIV